MRFFAQQLVLRREVDQRSAMELPDLLHAKGFYDAPQEVVWVAAFDARMNVGSLVEVARGEHSRVEVSIPILLGAVVASGCKRFWIGHNHPSGHLEPTELDKDLTRSVQVSAAVLGLTLEDSIIIGPPNGWLALSDEGLLEVDEAMSNLIASAGEKVLEER